MRSVAELPFVELDELRSRIRADLEPGKSERANLGRHRARDVWKHRERGEVPRCRAVRMRARAPAAAIEVDQRLSDDRQRVRAEKGVELT